MKKLKWLDAHFEETMMVILLVIITCVSMLQVVIRKLPWIPALTWAEEFCRFCWIWSVFISLPYTIRMSSMLRVTVLLDILPDKVRKVLNIAVYCTTTICMAVLGWYSITVVSGIYASNETSAAMLWPMWAVYSIMLFGFFMGVVRGVQQIINHIKLFNGHELTTIEMAMEDAKSEAENAREVRK